MVAYTGLGSLPGTDFAAAVRMILDELPFAFLPELPARGPWAGMIGRGLGLPSGLPAELLAGQWQLCATPGSDQRRARAIWRDDLDQLEENAQGFAGRFKVAVAGPWTLSAALGVARSGPVLGDAGARRDLAQALAESVAEVLVDLRRRLPEATLVLQLDEPSLPRVAAGAVPTPGGFFRHRAIELSELVDQLAVVTTQCRHRLPELEVVLHSCASWTGPGEGWPWGTLQKASGFAGFSFDLDALSTADFDALAALVDAGAKVYAGVLPTVAGPIPVDELHRRAAGLLDRIGVPASANLVLTPACGLAGWTTSEVRGALASLRRVAARVDEELAQN